MYRLLWISFLLFSLNSCGETDQKEKELAKQQKNALLLKLKAKDEALQKSKQETQRLQKQLLDLAQMQKEAFLKQKQKQEAQGKSAEKENKLSKIGIHLDNNKITIDTNKTKQFFQNLGKQLEGKIGKFAQDIQEGIVHQKEAGVDIDNSHINIDLNQSKHFLNLWGSKMQNFAKEFDNMSKDVNTQAQIKTH